MHSNGVSALKSSPFLTSLLLRNFIGLFWISIYSKKLQLLAHSDFDMPFPGAGPNSTTTFDAISLENIRQANPFGVGVGATTPEFPLSNAQKAHKYCLR